MDAKTKSCGGCAHFAALANECRAHSPQLVPIQASGNKLINMGVWPATRPENWCAEWKSDSPVP